MKKTILLIPFLLLFLSSLAQIQSKDSVIKNFNDIRFALINNYNPNVDSVKNNCWEGWVFVRFNLSNQHQFTNIAYTINTPFFIKNAIENAFTRISRRGVNIDQIKKLPDRTYILPLMIVNNQGCGFMTGWEDNNYKPDEKMKLIYEKRQRDYHQSTNSVRNIINFTDTNGSDFVDCVLLAPVIMPFPIY